jgi:hypothetical protein
VTSTFRLTRVPKSKTGKYSAIAERFRSRSLFLFHLSDIEFLKNYFALIPYNLPTPGSIPLPPARIEVILREEFGCEISDQLLLPPSTERRNEKQKEVRRANQKSAVADARASSGRIHPFVAPAGSRGRCVELSLAHTIRRRD